MRLQRFTGGLLLVLLALATTSCGTEAEIPLVQPATTSTAVSASVVEEPESSQAQPLPSATDPCANPVDFSPLAENLLAEGHPASLEVRGEERPLTVRFSSIDAPVAGDAVLAVMLHGGGGENVWSELLWQSSFLAPLSEQRPLITVMAQAESGTSAFWSQDETFNADYLEALNAELARSLCLERMDVVLVGHGQGGLAAVQGYCARSMEADVVVLWQGMVKVLECLADPVAIVSLDLYEFDPVIGSHWDGSWDPPISFEVEATGGLQSTPEDLAHWMLKFGCPGPAEQVELPVGHSEENQEQPDRPVTVLAARDCVEPIVAVGVPDDGWTPETIFKMSPEVVEVANSLMLAEVLDALG